MSVPGSVEGATEPAARTAPDVAKAQQQLKITQWVIPALTGGIAVLNAVHEVSVVRVFLVVDPSTGGLAYFPAPTRPTSASTDFSNRA